MRVPTRGQAPRRLAMAIICAPPGTPAQVCRGLGYFWLDGLFIALSFAFYNSFQALFLLGFGASNSQIGLMTSLSSLAGIVAYLAATRVTAAFGGRKRTVVFVRLASRVSLVVLAAVPFFWTGQAAVYATIALMCLQVVLEAVGGPAWTALVADIVPMPIRARYVASRTIVKSAARTVAVALAGQLIRALGFPLGFQAAFLCGAFIGLGAWFAYSRIPVDEGSLGRIAHQGLRQRPVYGRGFRLYLVARTVWAAGYQLAAPFFTVHLVRNLGGDASVVGILASLGSVAAVGGLLLFTRIVERHGLRRAWILASVVQATVPWLWAVAPQAWFGLLPAGIDGLLMAGLELVNLNTLLLLSSETNRTQFSAVTSAVLSLAAMVGPVIGGALSDRYGFPLVFALAGGLSLAGCLAYAAFVPEPNGEPTSSPLAIASEGAGQAA